MRSILSSLDNLLIFGLAESQLCCVLAPHGAAGVASAPGLALPQG